MEIRIFIPFVSLCWWSFELKNGNPKILPLVLLTHGTVPAKQKLRKTEKADVLSGGSKCWPKIVKFLDLERILSCPGLWLIADPAAS